MRIHLPNSAFLGNIDPFIKAFDPADPKKLIITANKKWISVHPVVLAMVAALAQDVAPQNIICESFEAKSKHYFERMKLFDFLGIDSGMTITEHDSSGRFIPITQVKNSAEQTRFITEMIPLLHLTPHHVEPIRYIVSELIRNVIEHSGSPHGALVAAQFYPKSNTIRIGIVDSGVGITRTIRKSHHAVDDLQSLRLALTPGITGTTSQEGGNEQNAGAGLFFIKSIAAINGDYFAIYSGTGFYKLLKQKTEEKLTLKPDPFKDRHTKSLEYPHWQGTVVGIDISLDVHEEFLTLLDHIRNTYSKAVRERKNTRYKKPNFI